METELWPNLLRACARRSLPVIIASARLTPKSVSRYRRAGELFSGVFSAQVRIGAQSAEDAARFVQIGAAQVQVTVVGNVKFDVSIDAHITAQGRLLRQAFGLERFAWVAGSTHAGEDEAVLGAHARLLEEKRDALLLLAPRHRDRFEAVASLLERSGLRHRRRSELGNGGEADAQTLADCQVMLVDTLGELASMYAAADVAFVGGSLVPVGGHNLLEPAALGVPVLCGPYQANNKDIAAMLLGSGAAEEVKDATALAGALVHLSGDAAQRKRMADAGVRIVAANRGSVAALLAIIEPLWARAGYR
jgi:3-deoxy-D-manno-octulosonic-acid transferase